VANRLWTFLRSDSGVLILLGFARVVFHLMTDGRYGFHRDELQTLDDARHLAWGFVAYPPITPLIGRLELALFGTSLVGFRVFAALAVSAVMVLAGLMAQELGGGRRAQVMAAVAVGISPLSLIQGAVLQYVSFDYLWGVGAIYFAVRLLKSSDPRWWVPIGVMLGLGMETRYTIGVLALGFAAATLLTGVRRHLASKWLWMGVAVSILLFLPNVIWQAQHHFISLEFLSYLRKRDAGQGRYAGFYADQLRICANLMTAPLVLLGLWFYLFRQETRRYRFLGSLFVVTFALFAVLGARGYYTAPIYPMLVAGGSVLLVTLADGLGAAWSRLLYGTQWALMAFGGALAILIVTPVAPFGSAIWKVTSKVHDEFREEIGWTDLAEHVADVYRALPAAERERTGILTGNYGEGGALNLYGPDLGLPHAMSLTNSFWYRGYDPRLPQTVILVGFDLDEAQKLFAVCSVAGKNTNRFGVENEESRDHPDILVCRELHRAWPDYWQRARRFG
jgi:hypothetical protein